MADLLSRIGGARAGSTQSGSRAPSRPLDERQTTRPDPSTYAPPSAQAPPHLTRLPRHWTPRLGDRSSASSPAMVSTTQSMESLSLARTAHPQAQQSATQRARPAIGPPHNRDLTQPPTDDPPWKISGTFGGDQQFYPSAENIVGGSRLGAVGEPLPTSPTSLAQYERARDAAQGAPVNPSRRINATIITAPGQKKQRSSSSPSPSSSSEDDDEDERNPPPSKRPSPSSSSEDDDEDERNPPPSKRRRPAPASPAQAKREESPPSGGAGRRRRRPTGR